MGLLSISSLHPFSAVSVPSAVRCFLVPAFRANWHILGLKAAGGDLHNLLTHNTLRHSGWTFTQLNLCQYPAYRGCGTSP